MIAIFFMVELNGSEWMGMLCMKQRKIQTIFWGQKRMRLWRSVPHVSEMSFRSKYIGRFSKAKLGRLFPVGL